MNKKYGFILILIILLMPCLFSEVNKDTLAIGTSIGYSSGIMSNHLFTISSPIDVSLFARISDVIETAVSFRYKALEQVSSPLWGLEIRFAPEIGFYTPFIGIGYVHNAYSDSEIFNFTSGMNTPYAAIAPLRFFFRDLSFIPDFITLFASGFELRYGPIIPIRKYPGFTDYGNFFATFNLLRLGAVFSFL